MTRRLTLIPAYGRDYSTATEVLAAWRSGADFRVPYGPYTSSRETDMLASMGYTGVNLRFDKQRGSFFVDFEETSA